jgi:fibronectin-binding autotransporter adhesin
MKTLKMCRGNWLGVMMQRVLVLSVFCLAVSSASAATEQWLGVPDTSATTNWTDGANWTASVDQTYYNEVQFTGTGAEANTAFSINNVLDATTGVAQMPIWQLDFIPLNGNYTTLINPGVTLTTGAGNGTLTVGADILNNSSPAAANAFETITLTGAGGALNVGGNIYIGQGSTTPDDTHNVTLDLSGLDNFADSGGLIYVAGGGLERGNGSFYLAKTNQISLQNNIQISNQNMSNSVLCGLYLGQVNYITLGNSDLTVGGTGSAAGAVLKFNPAFVSAGSVPTANFNSSAGNGRIPNFNIGNENGGANVSGSGVVDFTGGNVTMSVDSMLLGQGGSAGANATGTLTFDNGSINVSSAVIGNQTGGDGGTGVGIVNLNSNSVAGANATLQVNGGLTLAEVAGTVTPGSAGTINVNGGALIAGSITSGGGDATINLANGAFTLSGTAGTLAAPVSTLTSTDSVLNLAVVPGSTNIVAADLTTGGATNIINITSASSIASFPAQIPLIKFSSLNGAGYNFGLGTLPPLFAGHLVNNTANSSIDILFTSGSSTLVWTGTSSGNWDFTTANWTSGGSPAIYGNGDFVRFFDGANNNNVNLTADLLPAGIASGIIVSNNGAAYTFSGSGYLDGSAGLLKQGSGVLVLDNSGNNVLSGSVTIGGGTLQVGNHDQNGNLPGSVVDNANLVYARSDSSLNVNNSISGSGSFAQAGGGELVLSGANTFTGNVLVTNSSELQVGSSSAMGNTGGSVIVASGSTLDINNNNISKPIIVSGVGVDGNGAIYNSVAGSYPSLPSVTLSGNTTFNLANRFDLINVTLSTGGNAYNLTLNNSAYSQWQGTTVDPALANIILTGGTLGLVGQNSFGNPASTLTLSSSASITFYGASYVNKAVDFQNGTINVDSAGNVMNGAMTLEAGIDSISIGGGNSLTLSNVLSGSGTLYLNGGSGTLTLAGNSPSYSGNVPVYNGTLIVNGSLGGSVSSQPDTTVAGSGTVSGAVSINGTFLPGGSGTAGTFTANGGLTLGGNASPIFDLSPSTGSGNDLVNVTGGLTMNGNNISINPISGTLADGAYTLISYDSFNGSIGTAATTYSTAYTLVLTNNTATKQIQLIVSGTLQSSLLIWNDAGGNAQWDLDSSANWSNVTTHASSSIFNNLDTVVLNDSILNAATPATNITVAGTVVPAAITNNSSANYTIAGSGSVSGSGALVKQGSGVLTLNGANSLFSNFTGPVTISGGAVVGTNGSLAKASSITVTNGGTFDMAGSAITGNQPITVSGSGLNGEGALYNSGGAQYNQVMDLVLAGDTTVAQQANGSSRWDLFNGSQVTGAHNLTLNWNGNYAQWSAITIGSTVQNITLTNGSTFGSISLDDAFQNPATLFTVATNCAVDFYTGGFNGSLHFMSGSTANIYTDPCNLNGSTVTFENGAVWNDPYNPDNRFINSAVTLNGIVRIILSEHDLVITNVISGVGGVFLHFYDHGLLLSAANTYSGPTIIDQGGNTMFVALTNNGSISQSSLIFFGGSNPYGTRVDVSGRSDQTWTLADGQTLEGIGAVNGSLVVDAGATVSPAGTNVTLGITAGSDATGMIVASNNVTFASGSTVVIKLNGSGVNDQVAASGSINYGGTLNLVNISGSPLAIGNSFQVFQSGTASYNGSFAGGIVPTTPGTGLAWDLSKLSSGIIGVKAGATGPVIGSPTVSGGNLIFSGAGGTNNGTYYVLTTTNLLTPLADWTPVATNMFDATGAFSVTNALIPNLPQHFYIIKQ